MKGIDPVLQSLLDLDGETIVFDDGYWTKFEVKVVTKSTQIPHGIKYSLTLHDRNNKRILGYDNAHAISQPVKGFRAKRMEWDHKHEKEKVSNYNFTNPGQLLEDFWNSVDKIRST